MRFVKKIMLPVLLLLILIGNAQIHVRAIKPAIGDYVISSLYIDAEVKEDGSMYVTQKIDISECDDKELTVSIPTSYSTDLLNDGNIYSSEYTVSDIQVDGRDFKVEKQQGLQNIIISLNDAKDSFTLSYNLHMKDYHIQGGQLFYIDVISPYFAGPVQYTEMQIKLPKTLRATALVQSTLDNSTPPFTSDIYEKNLRITSNRSIKAQEGVSLLVNLPEFYFNYSDPINYPLIASIIIIILVFGSYGIWYRKDKTVEKRISFSPYPYANIPIAMVGYIKNGIVSEEDFFPCIIEWAIKGYIYIKEEGQTVVLIVRRELPGGFPEYEYILFNAIFGNQNMVTIDELMKKDFTPAFEDSNQVIYEQFKDCPSSYLFHSSSLLHQTKCCAAIAIPYLLMAFATSYAQNANILNSIVTAVLYYLAVVVAFIPYILILRYHTQITSNIRNSLYAGCGIFTACILAFLSYLLLEANTSVLYIFTVDILTLTYAGFLQLIEKRTTLGTKMLKQVLSMDNFMHHVRRSQLEELIYENPQYFAHLLPYAYALDLDQIWVAKFETLIIQKPNWFVTPPRSYSPMYWLEPMHYALEDVFYAITYRMNEIKKLK